MANPTIGATTPRIQYTATASQTVFSVPFEFLANADLAVYVNGTLKTLTTDYTLTGANTTGGGSLTFVTGRTAGDIVTILSNLAYSRDTNKYTKYGLLPAEVLEADFDAVQVQAKQLALADQFAIRAPLTDTGTPTMVLPAKATRAEKLLSFDSNGNVSTTISQDLTNLSTATVAAQAAQAAAEAAKVAAQLAQTNAETAETNAETAETNAETAQAAAEAARDSAQAVARMYASTAAGIAATTSGQYFSVPNTATFGAYSIYLNSAGVATFVNTVISAGQNTSYSNTDGQGNRTSSIVVSGSSTLLAGGTWDNLVDGATASNATDSIAFNAVAVSGLNITFDFGVGASRIINEVTWKQGSAASHGTWQWQGSKDNATWTNIGATFTLGGATTQTQTTMSANSEGYRWYRLLGSSGTASGAPYIQEVEFKIGRTIVDYDAAEPNPFVVTFPVSKLVAAYFFNEESGNTVYDQYGATRYNIDLTTPTNPNATRTAQGVKLASGLIQTPSLPSIRTVVILYRTKFAGSGGFLISGGASSGAGVIEENFPNAEAPGRIAGGGVGWHNLEKDTGADLAAFENNRGGWMLLARTMTTGYTSIFGLGGRHSTTTSRCAEFEIAYAFFFNDTLTTDEENAILGYVRKEGVKRGIYLMAEDCPVKEDVYFLIGESNADGRSTLTNLSAADRALDLRTTKILPSNGTTDWRKADVFELGFNQQVTSPTTNFGPEFGVAHQRRTVSSSTERNARILKLGKGSTYMAPSSTGVAVTSSWNINEARNGGLFYRALRHIQRGLQEMMLEGRGFGTIRIGFLIGLNDATSTTYAPSAATYQGYLQDLLDKLVAQFPGVTFAMVVYRPHLSDPSSNATALGYVRTAIASFDTANATVSVVDTDAYSLEADNVHYSAASSKTIGINLHG